MPSSEGISLGDVVLRFVSDTQNLDRAIQQVGLELPGKLRSSGAAADAVGDSLGKVGSRASAAGKAGTEAGEKLASGAKHASTEYHKAYGEISLVGELVGVTLPRHVRTFLAGLPAVGSALSVAFEATAVLFLVEALTKGAQKLTDWISTTYLFTESMKRASEAASALNHEIATQVDELKKLQDAYSLIGLQGTKRTAEEFKQLTAEAKKNADALSATRDQVFGLQHGLVSLPETINIVNGRLRQLYSGLPEKELLKKFLPSDAGRDQVLSVLRDFQARYLAEQKVFEQKQANAEKTFDQEQLAEQIAAGEKALQAAKKAHDALVRAALSDIDIEQARATTVRLNVEENQLVNAFGEFGICLGGLKGT